jgi:hypothetical protein
MRGALVFGALLVLVGVSCRWPVASGQWSVAVAVVLHSPVLVLALTTDY